MQKNESGQSDAAVIFGVVIGIVVLFFALFFGINIIRGFRSVPPDKLLLHYTGGPFQGTHFKEEVSPGTGTHFYGVMENYFFLPSTQRNYIISADPNRGDRHGVDTINTPSSDKVSMSVEASVYFKLNTRTDDIKNFPGGTIRRFFEQICLHDDCTDLSPGGGWDKMLDQYLRPQIDQALKAEIGKYNYVDEWKDPDVRAQIQNAVGPVLAQRINQAIGGEFFCGPDSTRENCTNFGFVLQAVNPPQAVQDQYTATAAATQGIERAKQEGAARVQAADADRDAQNARASAAPVPPQASAFIRAQAEQACAQNPNCHLVIVDGNSGSTIQVPTG